MNVKKIIAREGLIILCLFVVVGTCGFAIITLPYECEGVFQIKYDNHTYQITTDDYYLFEVEKGTENKLKIINVLRQEGFLKEPVDLLAELEVKNIGEKCPPSKKWHSFSSFVLLITIFAYPIYWLIRFIVWAIKTLRKP